MSDQNGVTDPNAQHEASTNPTTLDKGKGKAIEPADVSMGEEDDEEDDESEEESGHEDEVSWHFLRSWPVPEADKHVQCRQKESVSCTWHQAKYETDQALFDAFSRRRRRKPTDCIIRGKPGSERKIIEID